MHKLPSLKTYFYFMFPAVPLEIQGCDSPSCHQMPAFTVRQGQQHGRKTSKLSQDLRGAKRLVPLVWDEERTCCGEQAEIIYGMRIASL